MLVHSMANVHPDAKIGLDVTISSYVTVEDDVEIGNGTWIGPGAVIMSGTRIGQNCKIFPGAIVGSPPQDLKYNGEDTYLLIGDRVTIREYCTINKGTVSGGHVTQIGNDCLLMAYVHVAHDCLVGNGCILANNVTLAGHITIGNYARLGGMVAVHQFVNIGDQVMIGGGTLVGKDVPPYTKCARYPATYIGINSVGLRRFKFSQETINHILDIYRLLFVRGHIVSNALSIIETEIQATPERDKILEFIKSSKRGIIRSPRFSSSKKNSDNEEIDNI